MQNALVFLEVTMSKINTIIFLFGSNGKILGLVSVLSNSISTSRILVSYK